MLDPISLIVIGLGSSLFVGTWGHFTTENIIKQMELEERLLYTKTICSCALLLLLNATVAFLVWLEKKYDTQLKGAMITAGSLAMNGMILLFHSNPSTAALYIQGVASCVGIGGGLLGAKHYNSVPRPSPVVQLLHEEQPTVTAFHTHEEEKSKLRNRLVENLGEGRRID